MGFLVPLIALAGQAAGAVGTAIGSVASGIGSGITAGAHAIGSGISSILGGAGGASGGTSLSKGLLGIQAATTIATLAQGSPKPPSAGGPPITPVFGASLAGGANRSLAAQSPLAASSGTNTGSFAAPGPSGSKSLLGQ